MWHRLLLAVLLMSFTTLRLRKYIEAENNIYYILVQCMTRPNNGMKRKWRTLRIANMDAIFFVCSILFESEHFRQDSTSNVVLELVSIEHIYLHNDYIPSSSLRNAWSSWLMVWDYSLSRWCTALHLCMYCFSLTTYLASILWRDWIYTISHEATYHSYVIWCRTMIHGQFPNTAVNNLQFFLCTS